MRALVVALACAGCGPNLLDATFTSRVVQHETCKVVGDRPEVCTREESTVDVRVRVVERPGDNAWLYGIPRGGVSDRAILGSKDSIGGWVFVDEVVQTNAGSGCTLDDRLEIALVIDPAAAAVGTDPCSDLLGRETETTQSSAGCDVVNVPPLATTLTARRRWEKPPDCAP